MGRGWSRMLIILVTLGGLNSLFPYFNERYLDVRISRAFPTEQSISTENTNCPSITPWQEVNINWKDCEVTNRGTSSGYFQVFHPEGGNGSFDYCNTLPFTHYSSKTGDFYTYAKIRYTHFPNSEVGEYAIDKDVFNQIVNSEPCKSIENRFDSLSDDDLSSKLFPSRNYTIGHDLEGLNVLPAQEKTVRSSGERDVLYPPTTLYAPNGTYVNTFGNTVPSPYSAKSIPSGASAKCRDGTYSFSQNRRGTCSHHGGVSIWY